MTIRMAMTLGLVAGALLLTGCASDDVARAGAGSGAADARAASEAQAAAAREAAERAIADAQAFRDQQRAIEDHDPVAEAEAAAEAAVEEAREQRAATTPIDQLVRSCQGAATTANERAKQAETVARNLVGEAGASGVPEIRAQASQLMTRAGLLSRQAAKVQRDIAAATDAGDAAQLARLEQTSVEIAAACGALEVEALELTAQAIAAAETRAAVEAEPTPAEVRAAEQAELDAATEEFWMTEYESGEMVAELTTNKGTIVLEFFPDVAPGHVKNFVDLAQKGFYDGLDFHRVIPGFMVQGGCPDGNGTGGPGYKIKAEFNDRPHTRGTLSMARSQHPDSAGSQFFICNANTPHLDGNYTVFGNLLSGWDALDGITAVGSRSGATSERVFMEKVTIRPRTADDTQEIE